jgi:hypothetical protein
MAGLKIYKNKAGQKLYPVCKWENNQHKIYNAYDRAILRREDEEYSEKACAWCETVEKALAAFDQYVINGIVYATYEDGKIIKDLIAAYDVRGDYLRYC